MRSLDFNAFRAEVQRIEMSRLRKVEEVAMRLRDVVASMAEHAADSEGVDAFSNLVAAFDATQDKTEVARVVN